MGQLCCKSTGEQEERQTVGEGELGRTDGPLLASAVPPAVESDVTEPLSPEISEEELPVSRPGAESPESTLTTAKIPILVPPEADFPKAAPLAAEPPVKAAIVAESPEVVLPVVESSVLKPSAVDFLVPQDTPALPSSQQKDDRVGSSDTSHLVPGTPLSASITPAGGKYLDYAILQDLETIMYVQKSKVMVIMKGLPGSGKSFVAKTLKQMYQDAVVCSADNYFMRNGKYQFNAEELPLAHESCQKTAKEAAISGVSVIIIDNTNIRAWNYKSYLGMSREHHYTPLILEPQTPWAKDTHGLAQRNSHGVKKDVLDQKLKTYEQAVPLYFWWFLNEADSSHIISMAQDWLRKALQVQDFFEDFSNFSNLTSAEEMLSYYKRNDDHSNYKVLHATACVIRRGKAKNAKEYLARKVVKDSLGKCFTLQLIGFVITPRTFGVRLRLGRDALELWGVDDHELEANDTPGKQPSKESKLVSLANTKVKKDSCQTTLREGPSQLHEDRFCPTAGKGSRAHLTLGCAPGIGAKITGFDLIKVVSHEQEIMKTENLKQLNKNFQTFSIPEGELRTYGDGIWVIYPEKESHVNSLFSGFY